MAKPFLKTSDKETADKLIAEGFELLSVNSGVYTFVNDPDKNIKVEFANDLKKFAYSNNLEL